MILPGYLFQYYSRSTGGRSSERGGREENSGWNEHHPGQAPKRACGPRRLLAYMEDTWRHCGISNTWSMPLLGKILVLKFPTLGDFPQSEQSKDGKDEKIHYNWAKKFQSKSKWHKTIELFLCLFLQILTVHIVEDGFASAVVSTLGLCPVP